MWEDKVWKDKVWEDAQQNEAGDAPKQFENASVRRPLARIPGTKRACWGYVGDLGVLTKRCDFKPHPRGRCSRPIFVIPQARNTLTYFAVCAPRGFRDPCWGAEIGRSSLLFWLDLGLTRLPCFLCTP